MGGADFSDQLGGLSCVADVLDVAWMWCDSLRAWCLVAVGGFASLFGCAPVGRASGSVVDPT